MVPEDRAGSWISLRLSPGCADPLPEVPLRILENHREASGIEVPVLVWKARAADPPGREHERFDLNRARRGIQDIHIAPVCELQDWSAGLVREGAIALELEADAAEVRFARRTAQHLGTAVERGGEPCIVLEEVPPLIFEGAKLAVGGEGPQLGGARLQSQNGQGHEAVGGDEVAKRRDRAREAEVRVDGARQVRVLNHQERIVAQEGLDAGVWAARCDGRVTTASESESESIQESRDEKHSHGIVMTIYLP